VTVDSLPTTGLAPETRSGYERIRTAALECFAEHGTASTTMRGVAQAAGVSLGLVQHHFSTKAGLIKAVDDHVLELIVRTMSQPMADPPADSVADIGSRISRLFSTEAAAGKYMGRALVNGSAMGGALFDALMEVGIDRWQTRVDRGEIRSDVDLAWAVMNALVLALGAMALRSHLDRHLPQPFTTPEQLKRWQLATDSLLREGLFRPIAAE
jgi:AcrR family transcriptional regulator